MAQTFVADPLVPIELKLQSSPVVTLYQPGWHSEADTGGSAFPGGAGTVLTFETLADLSTYVKSQASAPYTNEDYLDAIRQWSVEEYATRLCPYDMVDPPELATGTLDEHEQMALGSLLAIGLDLLDQLQIDSADSQALRDDPDIGRLTSGDLLGGLFGSGRRRQHVVNLLNTHWPPCVAEIAERVTTPDGNELADLASAPASGSGARTGAPGAAVGGSSAGDGTDDAGASSIGAGPNADEMGSDEAGRPALEEVTDLVSMWFGMTDRGVYTLRTTDLTDGAPSYPTSDASGGAGSAGGNGRRLSVWAELSDLERDLVARQVGIDDPTMVALDEIEVDPTPSDELIFDLIQIGEAIGPTLSVEEADRLVCAWTELVRLAVWGGWSDVTEAAFGDGPLGRFMVSVAIDRAQDRPGATHALASADPSAARSEWMALIGTLEKHLVDR